MKTSARAITTVVILMSFLIADLLQAQTHRDTDRYRDRDDRREEPDFGIKGGFNYSNVWDEEDQEFIADSQFGLAGGIFLSLPMGRYLGLQPEALFSQKGYQRDGTFMDEDFTFHRRISYIDIPVQLQLKPSEYITILAGPQYSILLRDNWEYDFADVVEAEIADELEAGDIRDHLIAVVGGLDFNFDRAVISARVGWDMLSNEGDGQTEEPQFKNSWFQLTIGVRF